MAFRVKDLLINVLPPEAGEACDDDCGVTTFCGFTKTIPTHWHTCWPFDVPTVPWTPWHPAAVKSADPHAAAKQLSAMKAQLKESLAEIEAHEKRIAERSQPQTVEEIETLQGKLREALDELERRKSELKKR